MTGSTSSNFGRRRRTTASLSILLAGLALRVATAQAADAIDALMAELERTPHGRVSFTERHYTAVLDEPAQSSGELVFEPPDLLVKRTLKPRPMTLSAQGDVLTVEQGSRKHVVTLAEFPQAAPFVDSIRATLAGDRARLERHFRVEMSGTLEGWTLRLTPLEAPDAGGVRQIEIRGRSGRIDRMDILQADGDRSELSIGPPAP